MCWNVFGSNHGGNERDLRERLGGDRKKNNEKNWGLGGFRTDRIAEATVDKLGRTLASTY